MRKAGEGNLSCAFPGSLRCPWSCPQAGSQGIITRVSCTQVGKLCLPQIFRHLGHPAQQAAKELVKIQKCCLSCFCDKILSHHCRSQYVHEKYFGDLDVFHQTKSSVGKLLEKSVWWCMTFCFILLSEIQHDIMRQVSADSWEGNRDSISPGYLISCSSCNVSKTVPCLFMARGRKHSERLWLTSN